MLTLRLTLDSIANSGDSTTSQVEQPTQDGEDAGQPTVRGTPESLGPKASANKPTQSGADSSGDPKAKATVPPPSGWPQRAAQPPGEQAQKIVLTPPTPSDKVKTGELQKGDYSPLGTAGAIGELVAVAAKDAAVAASTLLHPEDPLAASLAVTAALTAVLKNQIDTPHAQARGDSHSSTPHSEKITQEATLSGILGDRSDLAKLEKKRRVPSTDM